MRKRAKIFYDPRIDFAEIIFLDDDGKEIRRKQVDPNLFIDDEDPHFFWAQLFENLEEKYPNTEFFKITVMRPDGYWEEYAPAPGGSWYVLT